MKMKILVCGSTGFLMANFIRYILYRSKDFEVVSIDNLESLSDSKRIYYNKSNRFYVGDFSDKDFLKKIIHVERPNYIVCGDEIYEYDKLLHTATNLVEFGIPSIMILPVVSSKDPDGMCIPIKKILLNNGQTALELPNRFGMRQKPSTFGLGGNVAFIIKQYLFDKAVCVGESSGPWVYAEDVASLLWYIIENKKTGLVQMPPLGFTSEQYIADKIEALYKKGYPIFSQQNSQHLVTDYKWSEIEGWQPDSEDLDSVLEKTIRWFDANRWAFNEE